MKVPDFTATPLEFITEQRYVLQLSRLNIRGYIGECRLAIGQCHVPKVEWQVKNGTQG